MGRFRSTIFLRTRYVYAYMRHLMYAELRTCQTYHVHDIAPFTSNLVAQVVSCPASSGSTDSASYIRFLLNDGVVPLTGISHCETPDANGLCLLDNFIQGMQKRIAEVDFVYDCYANYTPPALTSDPIIDGRMLQQKVSGFRPGSDADSS